jgi:hypothetical protein
LIGARVETTWVPGAFQLRIYRGQGESTRTAPTVYGEKSPTNLPLFIKGAHVWNVASCSTK